jgi:hypothetical protein
MITRAGSGPARITPPSDHSRSLGVILFLLPPNALQQLTDQIWGASPSSIQFKKGVKVRMFSLMKTR